MCMTITSVQLVVTSCGKVICSNCKHRLPPSTRTVPLTDKAPKEVLNLFTDISEQLKAVFKNYNFQENQKRGLLEYKEKKAQHFKKIEKEIADRKNVDKDKFEQMMKKLNSLEGREAEMKNNFNRMTSDPRHARVGTGQGRIDQFGQVGFGREAGNFGQEVGVFGGGEHVQGAFSHGVHQGHDIFGDQFGGGKGSNRQSLDRAKGRSGGGQNRSRERLHGGSPAQPGFLEMKTPAVWYHKQKDRVDRNSPQQKLMELGAVRRTDGGSRSGGSPFFTSPPNMGGQKITPVRRH